MSDLTRRKFISKSSKRNSLMSKSTLASNQRTEKAPSPRVSISQEDEGLASNVKAFARFRPMNEVEEELGTVAVRFESDTTVAVTGSEDAFTFVRVFRPDGSQKEVYQAIGQPSVNDVIAGYNATVFAYGQSGSGKTYTMMGSDVFDPEQRGVVPRAISDLFSSVMQSDQSIEFTIKCSLLEIYKEKLRDLFDSQNLDLRIKEDPNRGIYVENLSEFSVGSEEEMLELLALGERMRTVASTNLNAQSSRSHQLFMIEVNQKLPNDTEKRGVLNLVDLAGSEKIGWSGVTGNKLEETKKINLSLSALGNVIHALASHNEHIPYRDSKLTRLLQESLGGNFKTYLVVTCSPSRRNIDETITALKFGLRAGVIKNKVTINIKKSPEAYQRIIDDLKSQLALLRNEMRNLSTQGPELALNSSLRSANLTPTSIQITSSRRMQSTDCSNPMVLEELGRDRTPKGITDSFDSSSINFDPHEACELAFTAERKKSDRLTAELEAANRNIRDLEATLARNNEKQLAVEQRANEYYNNYHKLFRLIDKDAAELKRLRTQNDSLKAQLRHLAKSLKDLDARYEEMIDRRWSARGSTIVEMENCEDLFIGEDTPVSFQSLENEEFSDMVDLRALPIGSFLLTQPLTKNTYEQLEKNTVMSRELLVFNLRNQVVHAGLINANLVRRYHALDWKFCMTFHRLEEKSQQVESYKQRIKALEELIDAQHQSFTSIIKLTEKMKFSYNADEIAESPIRKMPSISRIVSKRQPYKSNLLRIPSMTPKDMIKSSVSMANLESFLDQPQSMKLKALEANLMLQQSFSQQLRKALNDSESELRLKERTLSELEQKVYLAHRQETASWRIFMEEFKENMETEVLRKHSEVTRLNVVLGEWIHKYLDLQQTLGIPSSRGSESSHRRNLSSVYVTELSELIKQTKETAPTNTESSPTIRLEMPDTRSPTIALKMNRGDLTPPISDR